MFKQSVILADLGRNDSATYLSMIYTFNVDWFPRKTGQKNKKMFLLFLNEQANVVVFLSAKNLQQNITCRNISDNNISMLNVIPVFLQQ